MEQKPELDKKAKKVKKEKKVRNSKGQHFLIMKVIIENAKKYKQENPGAVWKICVKEGSKMYRDSKK